MSTKTISGTTGIALTMVIVLIGVTGFVYTIKATAERAEVYNQLQDITIEQHRKEIDEEHIRFSNSIDELRKTMITMSANISIICGQVSQNCIINK